MFVCLWVCVLVGACVLGFLCLSSCFVCGFMFLLISVFVDQVFVDLCFWSVFFWTCVLVDLCLMSMCLWVHVLVDQCVCRRVFMDKCVCRFVCLWVQVFVDPCVYAFFYPYIGVFMTNNTVGMLQWPIFATSACASRCIWEHFYELIYTDFLSTTKYVLDQVYLLFFDICFKSTLITR